MKIGILQTGHCPDNLRPKYGDYDEFFKRFLVDRGFEFETYPVLDDILPLNINDADGWLVTGSKFGTYEDHKWIPPLEDFLRAAYQQAIPIVGICFGHQILARALGGKVEKFDGGWSIGVENYALEGYPEGVNLIAWHQDQVTELPEGATVIGSSPFCRYAALAYGNRAFTIQPHPEFVAGFVAELIESRRSILPADIVDKAINSLSIETASRQIADQIAEFFNKSMNQLT